MSIDEQIELCCSVMSNESIPKRHRVKLQAMYDAGLPAGCQHVKALAPDLAAASIPAAVSRLSGAILSGPPTEASQGRLLVQIVSTGSTGSGPPRAASPLSLGVPGPPTIRATDGGKPNRPRGRSESPPALATPHGLTPSAVDLAQGQSPISIRPASRPADPPEPRCERSPSLHPGCPGGANDGPAAALALRPHGPPGLGHRLAHHPGWCSPRPTRLSPCTPCSPFAIRQIAPARHLAGRNHPLTPTAGGNAPSGGPSSPCWLRIQ